MSHPRCSIIIPVRDEAALLPRSAVAAIASAEEVGARIVWVCNGCRDTSAAILRGLLAESGLCDVHEVLETPVAGKAHALQIGDDASGSVFPRVYLDADTFLHPGDLKRLIEPLTTGKADLVSPLRHYATTGVSWLAARMAEVWESLPHRHETAFVGVICLSRQARDAWGDWPDVTGDDIFIAAQVPPDRRMILTGAVATTPAPPDFAAWVRMRARWKHGEDEISAHGLHPPRATNQRQALLGLLLTGRTFPGALAFITARALGPLLYRPAPGKGWNPARLQTPRHLTGR